MWVPTFPRALYLVQKGEWEDAAAPHERSRASYRGEDYRPLETALVHTARERGCRVLDGGGMAVYQAVDAFRLFTGVEPDADRMLAHFTELVGAPGTDARVG